MQNLAHQNAYWDAAAPAAVFTHPLHEEWTRRYLRPGDRILDCGCGYGRTLQELRQRGHECLVGIDPAPAMVARARAALPGLPLSIAAGSALPFRDGSFDAVLLVAVLTAVPMDSDQRALVAAIGRALRPEGVLYVSDYLVASDERNRARYARDAPRFGAHGIFEIDGGARMRHHERAWIDDLLGSFDVIELGEFDAVTMRGNAARGFRCVARRPTDAA